MLDARCAGGERKSMNNKNVFVLEAEAKQIANRLIPDIKKHYNNCNAVYLPNNYPTNRAKYVFITMEPSLGRWGKDEIKAKKRIADGFKNFLWSSEDFIFQYAISKYLSVDYLITDISKIAINSKVANINRQDIYKEWIVYLEKEIKKMSIIKPVIFSVGNVVDVFIKKNIPRISPTKIIHYSPQAGNARKKARFENETKYQEFKTKILPSEEEIRSFIQKLLNKSIVNCELCKEIFDRFNNKTILTESRTELMYTYYSVFINNKNI